MHQIVVYRENQKMSDATRMTPQSPMLDKENASNRTKLLKETKKPEQSQAKTPLRKTPTRRQPFQSHHHHSPPSKVLRQHFAQLSITPRRTKIQSGAVRIQSLKKKKVHVPQLQHHSPTRVGIDGTSKTPSKELLRSTACSRHHQVPHVEHSYLHSHDHDSVLTAVELTRHEQREECCDPVALILLNDGKEDLKELSELDCAASLSPPPAIRKVSSNLEDVLDDEEVLTLVRPVATKVAKS